MRIGVWHVYGASRAGVCGDGRCVGPGEQTARPYICSSVIQNRRNANKYGYTGSGQSAAAIFLMLASRCAKVLLRLTVCKS